MFEITNDFDLKNTFDNGQCFRFAPYKAGYLGVALGEVIYLEKCGGVIVVDGVDKSTFDKKFNDYFDLERDYEKIADSFYYEENLRNAISYGHGMKILRQEPWETLISFLISQNNNIERIKAIVDRICVSYGKEIIYDGTVFHAFPTPEELKDVISEDYKKFGCGYRAPYLEKAVRDMLDNKIDFDFLASCGYFRAKEELMKLYGVGPKVADCICLFGLNYLDAFPVDTWIKKVMETLFLKRTASNREIWEFSQSAFGEYAGIAQQYLFYYAREHRLKGLEQ